MIRRGVGQVAKMSHLAARFVGGSDVHVVDPNVDLRFVFEQQEQLQTSVESRNLKIDLPTVKSEYEQWFEVYEQWKNAGDKETQTQLKKELRAKKDGLLNALSLPNMIHHAGHKQPPILKPSNHAQYLAQQGLMRIDKQNHVIHLVGFPVVVQKMIKDQLTELFAESQLISGSFFARAAVVEALNLDKELLTEFTDGSNHFPVTYLVGTSLASLISPFIKSSFSEKNNTWPISVQSSGSAYFPVKNEVDLINSRQRLRHSALTMTKTAEELDVLINETNVRIGAYLDEGLNLEVKVREVRGNELRNYESQAFVVENRGLILSRISRCDDYISKRLNIVQGENNEFVQMIYVETDIDRIIARLVDDLIDGKEPPKHLRDAIKRSY
ncbi:unnamed protein product [Caenorhabditis angaria]|uniref:Uncharacterized protein n=1 Tax=Caenorhabditis angaria TaxID=860376 RepID=A0A9P1IXN5_9PELO|nr:unnamed protein product [Caenorhabditis angaria]